MKKWIFILFIFAVANSCMPKLSKQFYSSKEEIAFQSMAFYLPNGKKLGIFSMYNYGILAIANDEIIFEVRGSSDFAPTIESFSIKATEIIDIKYVKSRKGKTLLLFLKTHKANYVFECFKPGGLQNELDNLLKSKPEFIFE
jgi:hypothetical protein